MDCSNARQMISEYLDGEMSRRDSEEMRAHIACCADCACALEAFRSTMALVADTSEIEPPAYLMEQILAATSARPTLGKRLAVVFGNFAHNPSSLRWSAASAAVVVALLAFNHFSTPTTQVRTPVAVKSPSPTHSAPIVAVQPAQEQVVVGSESQPVRTASARRVYSNRRDVASVKTSNRSATASAKPKVSADTDLAVPIEEQPSDSEASSPTAVAVAPAPVETQEIKVTGTPSAQAETVKPDEDALADIRAKLAARNKQRRYQVHADPVQGQKVTIELASIKF